MLKILQARLQQYINQELPDIHAGFRKGRVSRDQIANICWIIKKARKFQKNIYFCFIDYAKSFNYGITTSYGKFLKEMEIPDILTCLLRNLYAGQEATVITWHGKMDWLVHSWERSTSRLFLVHLTSMHNILCKSRAGWIKGWNQDCWEKYQ